VKDAVWSLLADACRLFGPRPTVLERDFNFPPYADLVAELATVRRILQANPMRDLHHAQA